MYCVPVLSALAFYGERYGLATVPPRYLFLDAVSKNYLFSYYMDLGVQNRTLCSHLE